MRFLFPAVLALLLCPIFCPIFCAAQSEHAKKIAESFKDGPEQYQKDATDMLVWLGKE